MKRIASKDIRQKALEAYEEKRGTQQQIGDMLGGARAYRATLDSRVE